MAPTTSLPASPTTPVRRDSEDGSHYHLDLGDGVVAGPFLAHQTIAHHELTIIKQRLTSAGASSTPTTPTVAPAAARDNFGAEPSARGDGT